MVGRGFSIASITQISRVCAISSYRSIYCQCKDFTELQARFRSQNIPAPFLAGSGRSLFQVSESVNGGGAGENGDEQLPRVFFLTLGDLKDFLNRSFRMTTEVDSVAGVSGFSMTKTSILRLDLFLELYTSMDMTDGREAGCFSIQGHPHSVNFTA